MSVLDSPNPNPQTAMSLISKILARKGAMTAEELADTLGVSRLTILRREKRGSIPSFRIGSCVRFDPANIAQWLKQISVKRMSQK